MKLVDRNGIVDLLHEKINYLIDNFHIPRDSTELTLCSNEELTYRFRISETYGFGMYYDIYFHRLKSLFESKYDYIQIMDDIYNVDYFGEGIEAVTKYIDDVIDKAVKEDFTEYKYPLENGCIYYSWNWWSSREVARFLKDICNKIDLIDLTLKPHYIQSGTHYAIQLKDHNGDVAETILFHETGNVYMRYGIDGLKSFFVDETISQLSDILGMDETGLSYVFR